MNQNAAQEPTPKPKPEPKKPNEIKEPIPKLRPVVKPQQKNTSKPQRPKSALIPPSGPLKPLQPLADVPVKQGKTNEMNPIQGYEYVSGPPREFGAGQTAEIEDFYSVPVKENSNKPIEVTPTPTSPFKEAIEEDLYQVPGQVLQILD